MQAFRLVEPGFYVTPQLAAEDMACVQAAGFASVINNRPDHEGGRAQPDSTTLAAAAGAVGLSYRHLPVPPSGHVDADGRQMVELVQSLPQPVLAFCRTGTRSAALYQKGKQLA
ncbi:MAG: TIGR01244 family sulfur transferase [Polaromonas sp.]|nr:TIGR01244 family sulfur transferase [Polaromonas sp.]